MDDLATGLLFGFVAAIVLMAPAAFVVVRRFTAGHRDEMEQYEASIIDLRQERAEDKETNRRLRHELVSQSPDRLMEAANAAELERDSAVSERDQAIEQLHLVHEDLAAVNRRLADREARIRHYRQELKEIRESLEAQDRGRAVPTAGDPLSTDTGEIPIGALEAGRADSNGRGRSDLVPGDLVPEDMLSGAIRSNPVASAGSDDSGRDPTGLGGDGLDVSRFDPADAETADVTASD